MQWDRWGWEQRQDSKQIYWVNLLSFSSFIVNFVQISISVWRSFRSWSQFGLIKDFKRCLQIFDHAAVVVANSWMKERRWQRATSTQALSAFWFRINYYWPPFGENCAQLFWNFKAREGIKYKSQFGKCSLQSYKFKICSRGTETSVICDEFAKAVACLVEGNDREPSIISMKQVLRSLKKRKAWKKLKLGLVDLFLSLRNYTALLVTVSVAI